MISAYLQQLWQLVTHFDQHLISILSYSNLWFYVIMFTVILCETGVILTPVLPGDALLITAGSLIAHQTGKINIHILAFLLILAAIVGNAFNYYIGITLGQAIIARFNNNTTARRYLLNTQHFYHQHGHQALIIARFMPIIRTFAPFFAGIIAMKYRIFICYTIIGAILWITTLLYGGYYCANLPLVKDHLNIMIITVVILSILPGIISYLRHKR